MLEVAIITVNCDHKEEHIFSNNTEIGCGTGPNLCHENTFFYHYPACSRLNCRHQTRLGWMDVFAEEIKTGAGNIFLSLEFTPIVLLNYSVDPKVIFCSRSPSASTLDLLCLCGTF